jgi:hypothetical protein
MRIVSNGIEALREHAERIDARDITPARDLLVVPNGSDHVALYRSRDAIHAHLAGGGALFVEDGWFTDWVPGNRWVHDNTHPTRDVRYRVADDRHGLFDGIDLTAFDFQDGLSGWWSCGSIVPSATAEVALVDTWDRPIVVVDKRMVLTASGPLMSPWLAKPLHEVFARVKALLDG